jgi:RimJ/RimL family protein N-acetyltransferase
MAPRPVDPPYAIRTERLLLRCWDPRDHLALEEAVLESLDHLRPWMPWAHAEPISREERIGLLRGFRGAFDLGRDFVYGIFDRDEGRVLGGTGLHTRSGPDSFEIGYWIRADSVGRGLATEATAALTRVAFEVCRVARVEIHVEPANAASLSVPRRLGFVEEGVLRGRLEPFAGSPRRDATVFSLLAEELPLSDAVAVEVEVFDVTGARLDPRST